MYTSLRYIWFIPSVYLNWYKLVSSPKELSPIAEKICAEHYRGITREDDKTIKCEYVAWIRVGQDNHALGHCQRSNETSDSTG